MVNSGTPHGTSILGLLQKPIKFVARSLFRSSAAAATGRAGTRLVCQQRHGLVDWRRQNLMCSDRTARFGAGEPTQPAVLGLGCDAVYATCPQVGTMFRD